MMEIEFDGILNWKTFFSGNLYYQCKCKKHVVPLDEKAKVD